MFQACSFPPLARKTLTNLYVETSPNVENTQTKMLLKKNTKWKTNPRKRPELSYECVCVCGKNVCDCVCIIHQKGHRKKLSFKQMKIPRDSKTFFSFSHTFLCTFHFIYIFLNTLPGKGASFSALHIHLPLGVCNFTLKPIFLFFSTRVPFVFSFFFVYSTSNSCIEKRKPKNRAPQPQKPHRPLFSLHLILSAFMPLSLALFVIFVFFLEKLIFSGTNFFLPPLVCFIVKNVFLSCCCCCGSASPIDVAAASC